MSNEFGLKFQVNRAECRTARDQKKNIPAYLGSHKQPKPLARAGVVDEIENDVIDPRQRFPRRMMPEWIQLRFAVLIFQRDAIPSLPSVEHRRHV